MLSYLVLGVSIVAAIWAAAMLTPFGKYAYVYFFAYSEWYMGVICLVSLSITIMLGLVATDRLVLSIRQRVLLQSAHRTTGVIAVGSLFVHVWTKVAEQHVGIVDVFIPFLMPFNTVFIGLGTLSAYVMVLVMWTGLARARFIGKGRPWMWRGIHAISYLMWPIALVHGLGAGRAAATWVTVSYVVCVLAVLVGLAVRLSVSLNRKKDFASQAGTGTGKIQPVGKLVPTTTPSIAGRGKGRGRRDDALVSDRGNAPAAAIESWAPAAGSPRATGAPPLDEPKRSGGSSRPVSGAPVSPAPRDETRSRRGVDDDTRARRRRDFDDAPTQRWEFEDDDMPAPRSRRGGDDAPAPRQRRAGGEERYNEPTGAISRRALAAGFDEDEAPAPRSRRRTEDDEPPARSRRYADTEFDEPPARSGRRLADEDDMPPRSRREDTQTRMRRLTEDDVAPAPRQRRYADDDRFEDTASRRRPSSRYADDEPARPARSARYDDEDSAPRSRRGRGADDDRADSGRHSRSEFVDLEADETPTLVDMASRRARRAATPEPIRSSGRGARRGSGRDRGPEESADDTYWRQLRGEAQ